MAEARVKLENGFSREKFTEFVRDLTVDHQKAREKGYVGVYASIGREGNQ